MQQALNYAKMLDVPFVYSSNGDAFLQHDRTQTSGELGKEIPLHAFPSPEDLWKSYCAWKNINDTKACIITQDYYTDGSQKTPRYYQLIAINRTIEAITRGQDRILLVMATGTGKTFTAFTIIWRLWKSRTKYVVDDVKVHVIAERVQYYGSDGKLDYFTKYGEQARKVLDALLNKYADEGIENIESMDVLRVRPINQFGTSLEIINIFGGKDKYLEAVKGMETQLYMAEA